MGSTPVSLLLVLVFCGLIGLVSTEPSMRAQDTSGVAPPGDPVSVGFAVPSSRGKHTVVLRGDGAFHVVVENTSSQPVNLWREWCSWGWYNLSFEIIDDAGNATPLRKKMRAWTKNYPDSCTVAPGSYFVYTVDFDPKIWEKPPLPREGKHHTVKLRAVFGVRDDAEAREHGVWTGRVTSPVRELDLYR